MAPPLRLVFYKWTTDQNVVRLTPVPRFIVNRGEEELFLVEARLGVGLAERLLDGRYRMPSASGWRMPC
jgi:hypothetical protein